MQCLLATQRTPTGGGNPFKGNGPCDVARERGREQDMVGDQEGWKTVGVVAGRERKAGVRRASKARRSPSSAGHSIALLTWSGRADLSSLLVFLVHVISTNTLLSAF